MDPTTKRQKKRDSAKKSKDHSIYTQKSIRVKEALMQRNIPSEKYGGTNKSGKEPLQSRASQ
jgi:hypothetical protein